MSTDFAQEPTSAGSANTALLQAFWRYENALMTNDVPELDNLFWNDCQTIRADHSAVLLGHEAIARFRASRTQGAPARTVIAVHVRELSDTIAVILAETCRPDGARGLQSQTWCRTVEGWKVAFAHVSAGPPRDATVWRKVGAPLVAATEDGVLSGTTVAVKDLFAVSGESIGGGTPHYLAQAPVEADHAAAVKALLGEGATVTGLAHTDELAYSLGGVNPHYGTPPNLAAPERIPGGSTSGPSVAVSSGEVDLGLGTDTAGSIRVPASYQGIWGLRPSHGIIDATGLLPLAPSFDTVGVLARDALTLIKGAGVLLPDQRVDDVEEVVIDPALLAFAEPEVAQSFWSAVRNIGLPIHYRDIAGRELERWFSAFRTAQAYEAWATHGDFLESHPNAVTADVAERFRLASAVTRAESVEAYLCIDAAREHLSSVLGPKSVMLLPSTSGPAPRRQDRSAERARVATLHLTCLASLSGRPALSAPLLHADGLPVGLCAVGHPGGDRSLLQFGREHLNSIRESKSSTPGN